MILIILAAIIAVLTLIGTIKNKIDLARTKREVKDNWEVETREREKIQREQVRLSREQEKQAAMLAKHEKRISDLEFKAQQAAADIIQEQARLDRYTAKLSELDEELESVNIDIEFHKLANKVDAEAAAKAKRTKIEDKIFSYEERVRTCEKRLSKAQHVKDTAERELSVA